MGDKREKSRKSKWKIAFGIIGSLILVWLIIYLWPVSKNTDLSKFDKGRPLVIAHGGGNHLAPSNTLAAFTNASELGVDVLEFDIHMTKDGHLVSIHDPTIDRTTDGTGIVNEMTLEEVQSYDAAYSFQDLNGEYSFRGQGVYIPTVEEIFSTINDPEMLYTIEIKDTNHPELYREMSEKLWELIKSYGLEENVIIAAFDHDIIEIVKDVTNGEALVSGGRDEITKFVIFHKLFLNGLYKQQVHALQIPTEDSNINLMDKKIIRGANKRGMQVHYWTINDTETMQELIDLGANGIMTDRPDLLLELLE
ncbi:glycerophosphodiester phosphodiesterase [Ornithinibacillus halotolerans]|uniref:Glycerophosphoryl diester phosphodiesterase n=1 Tax=Ornithinibacillus halotolerans TaxID=1274357 RepID=A0A916WCN9_9BACI|nr:glycerophosphodiester phosphodiesterase [Ornithinibacillus halotolerans]GGA86786.1 glycerophosphoryl diester phosphodiesterase [Ornithinibacillus halotolerans]